MIRLRFLYVKGPELAFFSHLDLLRAITRLLRRAEIPVTYSRGYHPRPHISMGPPLPLGATGEEELCDIFIDQQTEASLLDTLNAHAPPGLKFKKCWPVGEGEKSLAAHSFLSSWLFKGIWEREPGGGELGELGSGPLLIRRVTPKGAKEIDLSLFLRALQVGQDWMRADLLSTPAGGCRLEEIIGFLAEKGSSFRPHSMHREHLFLLDSERD